MNYERESEWKNYNQETEYEFQTDYSCNSYLAYQTRMKQYQEQMAAEKEIQRRTNQIKTDCALTNIHNCASSDAPLDETIILRQIIFHWEKEVIKMLLLRIAHTSKVELYTIQVDNQASDPEREMIVESQKPRSRRKKTLNQNQKL